MTKNFQIAQEKIKKFKNTVISITGTAGKTTTTKFLHDISSKVMKVNKTEKLKYVQNLHKNNILIINNDNKNTNIIIDHNL